MKNITFTDRGWADFMSWSKTDRKIFTKISNLIEETARTPFKGSGKPELLKYETSHPENTGYCTMLLASSM